jgi:inositol phosphorylceramide mannosyltransferase catalytic subunit
VLIPRIFHQIWLGPEPIPDELAPYRQSWPEHHPEWEIMVWTEENLPDVVVRPEVLEVLRHPAERSDILRYELMRTYGGVYVDVDFECLRSIEPLIDGVEAFAGYRKPGRVNNALVGSVPGHPLMDRALAEIRPRTSWGTVDKDGTGPPFLEGVLADFPEVTVFDPPVFYPRTEAQREQAYAVHHRARSWKDEEGLRASLSKTERRLRTAQEEARMWRLRCERAEAELGLLRRRSPITRTLRRLAGE